MLNGCKIVNDEQQSVLRLNLFLVSSDDVPICLPILTFKCLKHSP